MLHGGGIGPNEAWSSIAGDSVHEITFVRSDSRVCLCLSALMCPAKVVLPWLVPQLRGWYSFGGVTCFFFLSVERAQNEPRIFAKSLLHIKGGEGITNYSVPLCLCGPRWIKVFEIH